MPTRCPVGNLEKNWCERRRSTFKRNSIRREAPVAIELRQPSRKINLIPVPSPTRRFRDRGVSEKSETKASKERARLPAAAPELAQQVSGSFLLNMMYVCTEVGLFASFRIIPGRKNALPGELI